mmetsp:Transcript_27388/g.88445  ORF Transcript_27388/g.88445 Transcript_27388/m.88445 type:complete len:255 (-) Transcript_27388:1448-2212(-)
MSVSRGRGRTMRRCWRPTGAGGGARCLARMSLGNRRVHSRAGRAATPATTAPATVTGATRTAGVRTAAAATTIRPSRSHTSSAAGGATPHGTTIPLAEDTQNIRATGQEAEATGNLLRRKNTGYGRRAMPARRSSRGSRRPLIPGGATASSRSARLNWPGRRARWSRRSVQSARRRRRTCRRWATGRCWVRATLSWPTRPARARRWPTLLPLCRISVRRKRWTDAHAREWCGHLWCYRRPSWRNRCSGWPVPSL